LVPASFMTYSNKKSPPLDTLMHAVDRLSELNFISVAPSLLIGIIYALH
jgi:hypothetical protein